MRVYFLGQVEAIVFIIIHTFLQLAWKNVYQQL